MRRLVPEVIQTSAMDCGPAALESLLEGYGIAVSYGRLREACQTQVDGTSIDTLEEVACALGLDAEQVLIPLDHLFRPEPRNLPALAVVMQPSGLTHFVVLWNQIGRRIQVMDPACGRRWLTRAQLARELFVAQRRVPAESWRQYCQSLDFLQPLRARLQDLGGEEALPAALADPSGHTLAALDAAARAVQALSRAGVLRTRAERIALLRRWTRDPGTVPARDWYARPLPAEDAVALEGVVIVRIRGRRAGGPTAALPELVAALDPPARRPFARLLWQDGQRGPVWLILLATLVAAGGLVEALLLRSQLDAPAGQPRALGLGVLGFLAIMALAELPLVQGALRLGSRLEARFRLAFLHRLPRLPDPYFRSRPLSDLAERCHMGHLVRNVPWLLCALLRAALGLVATAAGMIWLDPAMGVRVALAAGISLVLPLALQGPLRERDGRVRSMVGRLSQFYFDALAGLVSIRAHGGEESLGAEHEAQLAEWKRAGLALASAGAWLDLLAAGLSASLTAWLFLAHLRHAGGAAGALLFLYWALSFPAFGRDVAALLRQLPGLQNVTGRLLEPLETPAREVAAAAPGGTAPSIELRDVEVQAGGHVVLGGVSLRLDPGEHVAVVGASGAGKSSLLGLLLGWSKPSRGQVLVDGEELSNRRLASLRAGTAWVDPEVHLENRSLHEALVCGGPAADLPAALALAELETLAAQLPEGLQTPIGEGGGALSGGEAQRVRFARALLRPGTTVALLDEPFRGLDRDQRSRLLAQARRCWRQATLLCVTHDVGETLGFPRVLVVEGGEVVEDGAPSALVARRHSRYGAMLEAERRLRDSLHAGGQWRRLQLADGRLAEPPGATRAEAAE